MLLYLPVLHAGYQALFDRHADAAEVLLLGRSFVEDFPALGKEIRALAPDVAALYLRSVGPVREVRVVERPDLPAAVTASLLVIPREEIMRVLVARHRLDEGRTVLVEPTFLRWDRQWSTAQRPADYDGAVSAEPHIQDRIRRAVGEAALSSDWWRQVGAIAVRDDDVLATAHNRHLPTEYSPYLHGDPRNDFNRGVRADLSTAIHAEADLIARAARDGLPLRGADLYLSTFPCPGCARLIAGAGFQRVYFAGPYAVLDGDVVLAAAGVDRIWVDLGDERPGGTRAEAAGEAGAGS